jgi:hypothetical protein
MRHLLISLFVLVSTVAGVGHAQGQRATLETARVEILSSLVRREFPERKDPDTKVVYFGGDGMSVFEIPPVRGYDFRPYDEIKTLPRDIEITSYWLSDFKTLGSGFEFVLTYERGTRCSGRASSSTYAAQKIDGEWILQQTSRGCGSYFADDCE